jgi:hypothetical protein
MGSAREAGAKRASAMHGARNAAAVSKDLE